MGLRNWLLPIARFFLHVILFGGLLRFLQCLRHRWVPFVRWLLPPPSVVPPSAVQQAIRRAAECRLAPSTRPPPEPDYSWRCAILRLIVGCIAVLSTTHLSIVFPVVKTMSSTDPSPPPPAADVKPTFDELESMLNKVELLDRHDQGSSPRDATSSHGDGGAISDDYASLAQVIAAAVASALRATQRAPSKFQITVLTLLSKAQ